MKKTLLTSIIIFWGYILNAQTLESFYSFNDSTTNDQFGNNHGVNNGATPTTDRFGNEFKAMHFDGFSKIEIGDSANINLNNLNAISISCWIRQDTFYTNTSLMGIVTKWTGSASSEQYGLYSKQKNHLFAIGSVASNGLTLNGNIDSTWTHLVVSYDVTGNKVDYYINGNLITSITVGSFSGTTGSAVMFIGSQYGGRNYRGDIDDVKIFSSALDSNQVVTLYNEPNPVVPTPTPNTNTGIEINENITAINIYPNPASNIINIESEESIESIKIISLDGRIIKTSTQKSISVSELENGMYWVEIETIKGIQNRKFIKQ